MGRGGLREGTREVFRIILWIGYVLQLVVSCMYIILDCVTFANIWQASGETVLGLQVVYNNIWRAPLAACLLSALLTLAFNMLTCVVLVKKSINRSGAGFGYGFVLAYCFTLAFFCILCSLVLDGFLSTVKSLETNPDISSWTSSTTQLYLATEVLGFVCAGFYLLYSLILIAFQAAIADQLGIAEDMRNPYAGLPEVPHVFVPPGYKSDTPALSGGGDADEQHYPPLGMAGGSTPQHYMSPGGYSSPPPGYGQQPAMASGYGAGGYSQQPVGYQGVQQYTTYETQEYETEAQGLMANNANSSPPPTYRPGVGQTF